MEQEISQTIPLYKRILSSFIFRVIFSLSVIAALYFGIGYGSSFLIVSEASGIIALAASGIVILLLYSLFFRKYEKRKVEELSPSKFPKWFTLGFLISYVLMMLSAVIFIILDAYRIKGFDWGLFVYLGFAYQFLVAVGEETIFRGVIYRMIEKKGGTLLALLISSFIFGFMHIWNPNATVWSSIAISVEAGLLLGIAYTYSGNLWLPIGIHCTWNFCIGTLLGLPVSGVYMGDGTIFSPGYNPHNPIIGGNFGPENSVIVVIFTTLISCIFIYRCIKTNKWIPFKRNNVPLEIAEENVVNR